MIMMRKLSFMFAGLALLAGLALSSCSKDDPANPDATEQQSGVKITLVATLLPLHLLW